MNLNDALKNSNDYELKQTAKNVKNLIEVEFEEEVNKDEELKQLLTKARMLKNKIFNPEQDDDLIRGHFDTYPPDIATNDGLDCNVRARQNYERCIRLLKQIDSGEYQKQMDDLQEKISLKSRHFFQRIKFREDIEYLKERLDWMETLKNICLSIREKKEKTGEVKAELNEVNKKIEKIAKEVSTKLVGPFFDKNKDELMQFEYDGCDNLFPKYIVDALVEKQNSVNKEATTEEKPVKQKSQHKYKEVEITK